MGRGTIAIEEATIDPGSIWTLPEAVQFLNPGQEVTNETVQRHAVTLGDLEERLRHMDAEGVEYMLLSLTSPGPQGQPDPAVAEQTARAANDWLAGEAAKHPTRFGGLAALSMHNATQAAEELKRAVGLGMFGAMINDFQSTGNDGKGRKYYDEEEYDVFWAAVQELGVPVYFHPRWPPLVEIKPGSEVSYAPRTHLLGAAVQFHLDLSFHLYAVISSGVFDRYPDVQIVAGHMGEGIPFNLWRANSWYNKPSKKATRPSKEDYGYYFARNVHITTSGFFSTPNLKFVIDQLGVDRVLYSIDTPYDTVKAGQDWWKSVSLPGDQKEVVGRSNAIKLFKLPLEL
ncbi:uncharacterized protein HMPREF1541_03103 [Cyphellophora europaea CBS 101466]|uniref:Amidohydrolase-related domain-containing protein n=1 Tax=Cyphellophora europaea (strain CBS 101466) TaxID=1220924 RepID=W2RZF9_CYPE1|nr:uncharacterized protein HMPREF1541_03103 [Cyphellophora europaea CBS 101466]ETN41168.1 hypothetical protein HMPREF1541_03103 [Cyphellophora europaea CBS 101466]